MRHLLDARGLADSVSVSSAATSGEEIRSGIGNPVYPPVKRELASHGISCEGKRAVRLTKADYEMYDLFVCMDRANVSDARRLFMGDPQGKICRLMDYTEKGGDVADPWYTDRFDIAYGDISLGCHALIDALLCGKEF